MRLLSLSPALLIGLSIAACTAYQTLAEPASDLAASPSSVTKARLTLRNGDRLTLTAPCVYGDSIAGAAGDGHEVRIALADVSRVQVPKPRKSGSAEFTDAMVLANSDMWPHRATAGGCAQSGG